MKKEYKIKTKNFNKLMSYLKKETKTLISNKKLKMSLSDIKIFTLNFSSLAISMTNIDVVLKLSLLVVSIGYTLHKWYLLNKNSK